MSLLELIVSMALTLTLGGAVMSLVLAGQTVGRVQPETSDLHQRARVAVQAIERELLDAGAGIDRGPMAGPLIQRFPPIAPSPDGGLTIWSAASGDAQASPAFIVAPAATMVTLQPSGACADGEAACGFAAGASAIAFTTSGCRAVSRITATSGDALELASAFSGCALDSSSMVAQGSVHTYRVDTSARQLIRRDEATGSSNPMLDGVASMTIGFFADAAATEPVAPSSDAELMRVRRVRVTLRFVAINGLLHIPDVMVTIDAAPPNLSGS